MVGSHAAEYFASRKNSVIVFDNLARSGLFGQKKKSVEYNWKYLAKFKGIKRVLGDVRNEEDLRKVLRGDLSDNELTLQVLTTWMPDSETS